MTNDRYTTTTTQAGPRRLERSTDEKVIAGVAGGLGQYFGLDPVIFRIAFVVLALAGASGILLYLLAWVLLPKQGEARSAVQQAIDHPGRGKKAVAVVLLVVGALTLVAQTHLFDGGVLWSALLIGAGALVLLKDRDDDRGDPPAPGPPTPYSTDPTDPIAPPPSLAAPPLAAPPPAAPPGRSLTAIVVSVLLVGGGVAGLAGMSATLFLSIALLVVGLGLLVGSRWGRSRGLIPVGLVVVVALGAASLFDFLDVSFRGGAGERLERPATAASVHQIYRQSAGELTVDLTNVDFDDPSLRGGPVEVRIGAGQLTVIVPADADVVVDAKVGVGELTVLGERDSGLGLSRRVARRTKSGVDEPDLRLEVRAGVGEVRVRRAAA
ncbi:MAG: PspC domain-containing protein [Acidimicrobiales bacterium]